MRYAQLEPGARISSGRRAVTEAEILEFASRYDPQWYHTDPTRARQSRWKGLIASGWHTCAIAMELAVRTVLADSESIGSPGVEQIRWLAPVRPGDELELRMEVLERSTARPGRVGEIRWRWLLANQRDVTVLDLVVISLFEVGAGDDP